MLDAFGVDRSDLDIGKAAARLGPETMQIAHGLARPSRAKRLAIGGAASLGARALQRAVAPTPG